MSKPATHLIINAGSSTIKYAVYDAQTRAVIERKTIEIKDKAGYDAAFDSLVGLVALHNVAAVGHRVVHGGRDYAAPCRIDAKVMADLQALVALAPLHQPHNLKGIEKIAAACPAMPQVACFDTAFHRTQGRLQQSYALPRALTDEGILRYGFHGISYEYIAQILPREAPAIAQGRVIVAHLGSGASLCAMKGGKSVATTMGFTPLDGLMMGTRTGAIDPGIPLYLMEQKGMSLKEISELFNKQSGLKGVSGISADMRELLASAAPEAAEAVELFCLYAARQIASLTVDLGGLDGIVFTAGIGERSDVVRNKICGHLAHLGVRVDPAANAAQGPAFHQPGSAVALHVIRTNEELMMAQHVENLVSAAPSAAQKPRRGP